MQPEDRPRISNCEAVKIYLSILEDRFRDQVIYRLELTLGTELKASRVRDDLWELDKVMEVAVRIASLSTGITYEVEKKTMSSSIAKKSFTRTSEGLAKPKKEEADEWQLKLSSSVDTHEAQLKEFGIMFQHNQELLKQVLAAVKTGQTVQNSVVPNMRQPRLYNPSQGNPAAASSMTWACFMCKDKSHKISDCPHQKRFVEKGWLVKNAEGKWVLKDGSRIPSTLEEQGKTRKTYVKEYAKT